MKLLLIALLIIPLSLDSIGQKKYLKKAGKHYANQDYLFAERYYEKYLVKNDDAAVKIKLLECYKIQAKNDKLQNMYKKIIAAGDDSFVYDYAQLLLSEKKYAESIGQFEKYLKKNTSDSTAVILKAYANIMSTSSSTSDVSCSKNEKKPYRAKYSAAASIDPENPNIQFIWKFDDGEIKKGVVVTKVYETPGEHTVVMSSKDLRTGYIDKDVLSNTLTFQPNLTFNYNSGKADIRANEKSSFAIDVPDVEKKYIWNLGDGNFRVGPSISHEYLSGKQYQLNLYVMDNSLSTVSGCVESNIPVLNNFENKK